MSISLGENISFLVDHLLELSRAMKRETRLEVVAAYIHTLATVLVFSQEDPQLHLPEVSSFFVFLMYRRMTQVSKDVNFDALLALDQTPHASQAPSRTASARPETTPDGDADTHAASSVPKSTHSLAPSTPGKNVGIVRPQASAASGSSTPLLFHGDLAHEESDAEFDSFRTSFDAASSGAVKKSSYPSPSMSPSQHYTIPLSMSPAHTRSPALSFAVPTQNEESPRAHLEHALVSSAAFVMASLGEDVFAPQDQLEIFEAAARLLLDASKDVRSAAGQLLGLYYESDTRLAPLVAQILAESEDVDEMSGISKKNALSALLSAYAENENEKDSENEDSADEKSDEALPAGFVAHTADSPTPTVTPLPAFVTLKSPTQAQTNEDEDEIPRADTSFTHAAAHAPADASVVAQVLRVLRRTVAHGHTRRARAEERRWLRDVLGTLEEQSAPTLQVSLTPTQRMRMEGWPILARYAFLARALGGALQLQIQLNPAVRQCLNIRSAPAVSTLALMQLAGAESESGLSESGEEAHTHSTRGKKRPREGVRSALSAQLLRGSGSGGVQKRRVVAASSAQAKARTRTRQKAREMRRRERSEFAREEEDVDGAETIVLRRHEEKENEEEEEPEREDDENEEEYEEEEEEQLAGRRMRELIAQEPKKKNASFGLLRAQKTKETVLAETDGADWDEEEEEMEEEEEELDEETRAQLAAIDEQQSSAKQKNSGKEKSNSRKNNSGNKKNQKKRK